MRKNHKMRIFIKIEQRYLSDVYDEEVRKKAQDGADGVLYSAKEKDAVLIDKKRNRETNIEIRW